MIGLVLRVAAVVCFTLAAFGVPGLLLYGRDGIGAPPDRRVDLVAMGLACWSLGTLVG